jgi:hypothetical protein
MPATHKRPNSDQRKVGVRIFMGGFLVMACFGLIVVLRTSLAGYHGNGTPRAATSTSYQL